MEKTRYMGQRWVEEEEEGIDAELSRGKIHLQNITAILHHFA